MHKLSVVAVSTLVAGAFVAGVAVGKTAPAAPRFLASEEVKWEDNGGYKLGTLYGDAKKGPYGALIKVPAGTTSPLHMHTGVYEGVQVQGTSSHWLKGEDGTKAKKMTPGSYYSLPAKLEHVSSCAPGKDCIIFIWQKVKYDAIPSKDETTTTAGAAGGAGVTTGVKAGAAASMPAPASPAPPKAAGSAAPAPKK